MHSSHHIRSGFMDGSVNHIPGRVDRVHVASFLDFAAFTYQDQILGSHVAEGFAVWIDPEVVGQNGVADRDVPSRSLIVVAVVPEPP